MLSILIVALGMVSLLSNGAVTKATQDRETLSSEPSNTDTDSVSHALFSSEAEQWAGEFKRDSTC